MCEKLIMPKEDKKRDWQKKLKQTPNTKGVLEYIVGALIILLIVFFIFQGFKSVTGFFGGKSDAKAACGRHSTVLNAKTDYAAKKAFKACLKRY